MMGLYLDRPAHMVDPKGFAACNNARIEFNQVRTDLMGWESSSIEQLPGPCLYLSRFVNSQGLQRSIAITPTDIILLQPGEANTYITPEYTDGHVSIANGSTTLFGSQTFWADDIQGGTAFTANANAAEGATTLQLDLPLAGAVELLAVTDQTNGDAIQVGTFISSGFVGPTFIGVNLTQALIGPVTAGDTIFVGSGISLRPNVRPGDMVSIGSYTQNSIAATWYEVATVTSNGQLTLTTPYAGTSVTFVPYRIRACLTNTVTGSNPYIPTSASVNYPNGEGP